MNRGRVGAAAFAMLLLACITSCTNQHEPDERTRPGSTSKPSSPEHSATAMDTTSIPVTDWSHFPVLADAYRRVDPKADGSLKDHSAATGVDWLDYRASALIIDVDNDGYEDLLVANGFASTGDL